MPPPRLRLLGAAAVVLVGLTACTGTDAPKRSDGHLAGGTLVDLPLTPEQQRFSLTAQDGTTFTLGSLRGKTVVLTDFLTRCQEICPMISVTMQQVARAVDEAGLSDRIIVLEGTVDAAGDRPKRLAAYYALFPAQDHWRLFTAGAETEAFWASFGVGFEKIDAERPYGRDWQTGDPVTYDYEHQDGVFIIDGSGHERWVATGAPSTSGEQPPTPLDDFLNDEGHEHLTDPGSGSWTAAQIEQALSEISGHRIG